MKIKDLPQDSSLANIRFICPNDGQTYYWYSQWTKGVWGKKDINSGQIFPLVVDDLTEVLEWEIADETETKPKKKLKKPKQSE